MITSMDDKSLGRVTRTTRTHNLFICMSHRNLFILHLIICKHSLVFVYKLFLRFHFFQRFTHLIIPAVFSLFSFSDPSIPFSTCLHLARRPPPHPPPPNPRKNRKIQANCPKRAPFHPKSSHPPKKKGISKKKEKKRRTIKEQKE